MWSFRSVWFPTCNLNYMSNMFNDAMQRQRCLIHSRWTIWTCRCLTTGFWHQKMGGTVRSQRYSFGLHRSGTFWVASWSTSYDLRWWSCGTSNIFIHSQNDIFDPWSSLFSKVFAMNKKALISDVCKSRFFSLEVGCFGLLKRHHEKRVADFFATFQMGDY